ncbi:hypothetical protein Trydic_g15812 [Trypoxylus dichotomus]
MSHVALKMSQIPSTSRGVRFTDDDFEKTLLQWYNECSSNASDKDVDDDLQIESEHDTASELSEKSNSDLEDDNAQLYGIEH